jgi:23S rRNA pseudouridine955/2504/2580 synthase
VSKLIVSEDEAGQRIDNFLQRVLSKVPKTRLYKAIRKGEIRVNKGRVKPDTRIEAGDEIRLPPLHVEPATAAPRLPGFWAQKIQSAVLYDDERLLVINKPSGLAVHGGSGVSLGLIESLRQLYPEQRYLELVHRLDRDTSGLLLVAKRASVLRELHQQLREKSMRKSYLALVQGRWPPHVKQVSAPLEKYSVPSGERLVRVSGEGRPSLTHFRVVERFKSATLVEASPVTGRTHQIRVHALHAGHPILGDAKYSNPAAERLCRDVGLARLFLHAAQLEFTLGDTRHQYEAPLSEELLSACSALRAAERKAN